MEEDEQYTILNGLRVLSHADFRISVITKLNAPSLVKWCGRDLEGWRRDTRADALVPLQTRLPYYASSKRARAVLGQSRSTIDLRQTIRGGGILMVNAARDAVGRHVTLWWARPSQSG